MQMRSIRRIVALVFDLTAARNAATILHGGGRGRRGKGGGGARGGSR